MCGEMLSRVSPSLWNANPVTASMADLPCLSSAARRKVPVASDPYSEVSLSQ